MTCELPQDVFRKYFPHHSVKIRMEAVRLRKYFSVSVLISFYKYRAWLFFFRDRCLSCAQKQYSTTEHYRFSLNFENYIKPNKKVDV